MIEKSLGRRIATLRKSQGLTQETFAEKCGYSVEFVSLVERGINAPSVDGLAKIAKVLKVEVKELFEFGGEDFLVLMSVICGTFLRKFRKRSSAKRQRE